MLREVFGIEISTSNMNRLEDGTRFEPFTGNPDDGHPLAMRCPVKGYGLLQ
jgi:hypothetical protein